MVRGDEREKQIPPLRCGMTNQGQKENGRAEALPLIVSWVVVKRGNPPFVMKPQRMGHPVWW
jgi:hypothetical protein